MKKTIALSVGLILVLIIAGVLYNSLSKNTSPQTQSQNQNQNQNQNENKNENDKNNPDSEDESTVYFSNEFTVEDKSGNKVKFSDFKGKPAVVNLWASWCPPCKGELPDFEEAYKRYGKDVNFMMIDLVDGYQETKEKGVSYIESMNFTFPVYFDTTKEVSYKYSVRSIPLTFFFDKNGEIVNRYNGMIDANTLENEIAKLLQ